MLRGIYGRVLAALVAGLVLSLAFEPVAFAYVAPFSVAGFALSTRGLRSRSAWIPGLVFGLAFYAVHIEWMRSSVGWAEWIALSVAEALFYALLGAVAAAVHRLRAWPAWLALAWLTMELARSSWPFGGMPWGRLGFAVVDTPVAPLLGYVGVNGVSLTVALLGCLLARLIVATRTPVPRERLLVGAGLLVVLAAAVLPDLVPERMPVVGQAEVAAVQGGVPGRGDDVAAHYRQVTENQATQTEQLAAQVAAGDRPPPDFVVWPENSTAIDPFVDTLTTGLISNAVTAIGVPVLVGAIVNSDAGHVLNQGIVWSPATGAGDRYTKWHPVPYGEYIPLRSHLARFSLRLDAVPRDMRRGTRQSPITIAGVKVADAICFDVAYDDGITAQVEHGAQLLTVQTSNASFVFTDQLDQQFAITRARAIETDRWVVVSSINGISGVIAPDGHVVASLGALRAGVLEERVGLIDGVTPGLRVGAALGWLAPLGTVVSLAAGALAYRRRSGRTPIDASPAPDQPDEPDQPDDSAAVSADQPTGATT